MPRRSIAVGELRARLAQVMQTLQRRRTPLVVTERGRTLAVLIPPARYEALIERLEYLDDSVEALLGEQRRAAGEKTRPLAAVMRSLAERDRHRRS